MTQETIRLLKDVIAQLRTENRDLRNELCYRCGIYINAHLGACDGCRWRK